MDLILDGVKAFEDVLFRAGYSRILHAVAAHTVFLHPETVAQTNGEALFPVIRTRNMDARGRIVEQADGRRVLLDDNTSPQLAFQWAAQRKKGSGSDVQFNHILGREYSQDPDLYTALLRRC